MNANRLKKEQIEKEYHSQGLLLREHWEKEELFLITSDLNLNKRKKEKKKCLSFLD